MDTTKLENYGAASGNPKCANCMVSCGYEAPAVMDGFGFAQGFYRHGARQLQTYPMPTRSRSSTNPARDPTPRWCRSRHREA